MELLSIVLLAMLVGLGAVATDMLIKWRAGGAKPQNAREKEKELEAGLTAPQEDEEPNCDVPAEGVPILLALPEAALTIKLQPAEAVSVEDFLRCVHEKAVAVVQEKAIVVSADSIAVKALQEMTLQYETPAGELRQVRSGASWSYASEVLARARRIELLADAGAAAASSASPTATGASPVAGASPASASSAHPVDSLTSELDAAVAAAAESVARVASDAEDERPRHIERDLDVPTASTWALGCDAKLRMRTQVPRPLSLAPSFMLSGALSMIASAVAQALMPRLAEFLVADYERWAKGEERTGAVGSFEEKKRASKNDHGKGKTHGEGEGET